MEILYDLMIKITEQEKIPEEWRGSTMIRIFKGKGNVQECTNYRRIKLMSHTLKILERMMYENEAGNRNRERTVRIYERNRYNRLNILFETVN